MFLVFNKKGRIILKDTSNRGDNTKNSTRERKGVENPLSKLLLIIRAYIIIGKIESFF